jgi:DNA integrity scanning protein DisA with diadenylate cyclase activity
MQREELFEQLVRYKKLCRIHKEIAERAEQHIRDLEHYINTLEKELEELRSKPAEPPSPNL